MKYRLARTIVWLFWEGPNWFRFVFARERTIWIERWAGDVCIRHIIHQGGGGVA